MVGSFVCEIGRGGEPSAVDDDAGAGDVGGLVALLINVGCHSDAHEQAKWFGDDIATANGGGSVVEMTWTREFKRGPRGRFFGGLFAWSWLAIEPALARHLTALTTGWTHELTDVIALRLGSDQRARTDARLAVGALTGVLNAAGELWLSSGLRGGPAGTNEPRHGDRRTRARSYRGERPGPLPAGARPRAARSSPNRHQQGEPHTPCVASATGRDSRGSCRF